MYHCPTLITPNLHYFRYSPPPHSPPLTFINQAKEKVETNWNLSKSAREKKLTQTFLTKRTRRLACLPSFCELVCDEEEGRRRSSVFWDLRFLCHPVCFVIVSRCNKCTLRYSACCLNCTMLYFVSFKCTTCRVNFFQWSPPKKLEYRKSWLGESMLT